MFEQSDHQGLVLKVSWGPEDHVFTSREATKIVKKRAEREKRKIKEELGRIPEVRREIRQNSTKLACTRVSRKVYPITTHRYASWKRMMVICKELRMMMSRREE